MGQRLFRHIVEVHRQAGPDTVPESELARAAAGAENDRGALAVEWTIGVPGILKRLRHNLQRQQLERIDRRQRRGWNAVLDRIEWNLAEEAAPLRINLVARTAIGIVIKIRVEPVARNLADRVGFFEDLGPKRP